MSSCSRASRAALVMLLGCMLTMVSLLAVSDPAAATPGPTPTPSGAIDVLPGVLPPVYPPTLPSVGPIDPDPILGGVASTVNGVAGTVGRSPGPSSTPSSTPSTAIRTPAAPASHHADPTPAVTGPRPERTATPAPALVGAGSTSARPAAPSHSFVLGGGSGPARTNVVSTPNQVTGPATLVREAAAAVMHPGLALLTVIAITAVCALGMLALVASLGRRTW